MKQPTKHFAEFLTEMRRYRLTYTYRNGAREPASPFATATVVFDDPSAAHEYGLKLKQQGHVNIRIEPFTEVK